MRRIYIAGPYRAATPSDVDRNILQAREAQAELLRRGHAPFCPHAMTAQFERSFPDIPDECYLESDKLWLRQCEALVLLPGWEKSEGARGEVALAEELGLVVFMSASEVPAADEWD